MAFPKIIYGRYGDEKKTSSAAPNSLELGTRMVLPDGREFALAYAGGTALSRGVVCTAPAVSAADLLLNTTGSAAVGATTVYITFGATAGVAVNELKDGYLMSFKGGTAGYMYKIKQNTVAAASETSTVTLYESDELKAPMAAGTTYVFPMVNPFNGVIVRPASTQQTGVFAGVTANSVAINRYFWIQRKGPVQILASETVGLVGELACCSTADAGGVTRRLIDADTTTIKDWAIGRFMVAPAQSTDYATVCLELE